MADLKPLDDIQTYRKARQIRNARKSQDSGDE